MIQFTQNLGRWSTTLWLGVGVRQVFYPQILFGKIREGGCQQRQADTQTGSSDRQHK